MINRNQNGFTLLELVMVMTIVLILIAVSVTSYQQIQLKARETVLKQNLVSMRKAIDEYAADREKLPASLEDLVSAKYINEVPLDPITGEADWDVEMGEDTISRDGGSGVVDVHSNARGTDSAGKAYSEY
ncbi:MAG TPA: type II secretion system protein [Blastocatellia bacterium]|jgi:general secretion pathway protein G|nr:type II secretion system protein [Blastocatellia bacterium]